VHRKGSHLPLEWPLERQKGFHLPLEWPLERQKGFHLPLEWPLERQKGFHPQLGHRTVYQVQRQLLLKNQMVGSLPQPNLQTDCSLQVQWKVQLLMPQMDSQPLHRPVQLDHRTDLSQQQQQVQEYQTDYQPQLVLL
jgi:hypothetical protein